MEADDLDIDAAQIQEYFKNLYWTRLVSVGEDQLGQDRKWPLGPDIVEEC